MLNLMEDDLKMYYKTVPFAPPLIKTQSLAVAEKEELHALCFVGPLKGTTKKNVRFDMSFLSNTSKWNNKNLDICFL